MPDGGKKIDFRRVYNKYNGDGVLVKVFICLYVPSAAFSTYSLLYLFVYLAVDGCIRINQCWRLSFFYDRAFFFNAFIICCYQALFTCLFPVMSFWLAFYLELLTSFNRLHPLILLTTILHFFSFFNDPQFFYQIKLAREFFCINCFYFVLPVLI